MKKRTKDLLAKFTKACVDKGYALSPNSLRVTVGDAKEENADGKEH